MKRPLCAAISLALAISSLWALSAAATARTPDEAARCLSGSASALALLRFERGEILSDLSLPASLALGEAPLLLEAAPEPALAAPAEPEPAEDPAAPQSPAATPEPSPEGSGEVRDNGVSATTLRPSDGGSYLVSGRVYVNNASSAALTEEQLRGGFPTLSPGEGPQVLILHTHGCEAYTMPPGEEYEASDDHRTLDETKNVLRVGDEIARVLEAAGIGVLHDRTLHDYPSYSGAYNRSLATARRCMEQYPSIAYVLDVHRDAVEDAEGSHYKLVCAESPGTAQLEFVIGSDGGGLDHSRWRENLRLACAVQERLLSQHPTLLRPIIVRNSRYNQQVCPGALLLEAGAAGNSLEEALNAARLFAQGFAETIQEEAAS